MLTLSVHAGIREGHLHFCARVFKNRGGGKKGEVSVHSSEKCPLGGRSAPSANLASPGVGCN